MSLVQRDSEGATNLLNNTASVHLDRELGDVALHLVCQLLLLRLVAMLEELLDHVVAKHVGHQLKGVGVDLGEELGLLVAIRRLQLGLDEPRAVLVATKLHDVVVDILVQVRRGFAL